jgi:hypothetical protein
VIWIDLDLQALTHSLQQKPDLLSAHLQWVGVPSILESERATTAAHPPINQAAAIPLADLNFGERHVFMKVVESSSRSASLREESP